MRDETCTMPQFRRLLHEIGLLMVFEVTRTLETRAISIRTPVAPAEGRILVSRPVLVTILRAGIGLLEPFAQLLPESPVGFLGMQRNETTLKPEAYYAKIPDVSRENRVILIDPMLATGGSAEMAVAYLKEAGFEEIVFVALVAAPEGIDALSRLYPDLSIFVAAEDARLNAHGYIVPGLGDAGDRYFGTENGAGR
jgi:uracil phosphoribosyltransferase